MFFTGSCASVMLLIVERLQKHLQMEDAKLRIVGYLA